MCQIKAFLILNLEMECLFTHTHTQKLWSLSLFFKLGKRIIVAQLCGTLSMLTLLKKQLRPG